MSIADGITAPADCDVGRRDAAIASDDTETGSWPSDSHVPVPAFHTPPRRRRAATDDAVSLLGSTVPAIQVSSVLLAAVVMSGRLAHGDRALGAWLIAVAVSVGTQILWRQRRTEPIGRVADVADLLLPLLAAAMTGAWRSPFVPCVLASVARQGLLRGLGHAAAASLAVIGVLTASARPGGAPSPLPEIATVLASLGVAAVLADVMRRRLVAQVALDSDSSARVDALSNTNDLLRSLHRLTQTHPASLNVHEVVDASIHQLRTIIPCDAVGVLMYDETEEVWITIRKDAAALGSSMTTTELPGGMVRALAEPGPVVCSDLTAAATDGGSEAPGFAVSSLSRSGVYAALSGRGAIVGLLAIESRQAHAYPESAVALVRGFIQPLALALDNARWFSRLRTVGADEERRRIARDLHDRLGQSLAYLGFELDRIVTQDERGADVGPALGQLRSDVRGVIREVRDTLYDLRTDVSDSHNLGTVIAEYADRVRERSDLDIHLSLSTDQRLALVPERELWRIAQEALTNIERHARASEVRVGWQCDGERGQLTIADNGIGFTVGRSGRLDSYGLAGMRERAASIGAHLDIESTPGRGTIVTCTLDPSRVESPPRTPTPRRRQSDRRPEHATSTTAQRRPRKDQP